MAAIDFPTATSNGQTFEADSGVIYTYVGTPPNGFWSGTFATTGLNTLDGRYIAKNDENNIQTIQTQGLKFNNGSADTILIDGLNGKIGIGTTSPDFKLDVNGTVGITEGQTVSWHDGAGSLAARIYASSTDELRFEIGSSASRAMTIDSAGRLGVGTSTPSESLEVAGNGFKVSGQTSSVTDEGLTFDWDSGSNNGRIFSESAGSSNLLFYTTASGSRAERMRIDSAGNVGIGSSNPTSLGSGFTEVMISGNTEGAGLQLQDTDGNVKAGLFTSDNSNTATLRTITNHPLTFRTNNTEAMRISSGMIGIGTTSPANVLHIKNDSPTIRLESSASSYVGRNTIGQYQNGLYIDCDNDNAISNSFIAFGVDGNEAMRIDSSGNVAIGTTSIDASLHVKGAGTHGTFVLEAGGTSGISNQIYIQGHNNAGTSLGEIHFEETATNQGALVFKTNGGSVAERMRIDSSGRVLINHAADAAPASYSSKLQLCDTSYQGASLLIRRDQNSPSAPALLFTKTRSATKGGSTAVQNGDICGQIIWYAGDGTDANSHVAFMQASIDGTPGSNDMPGRLTFHTTADSASVATERLRINHLGRSEHFASDGNVLGVGTTSGAGASDYAFYVVYGRTAMFTGGAVSFGVFTNGNTVNANNSYGAISDVKLKENIVDASSQWDDIKALQVRNYNFIEGQTHTQIGVVAQEVETVSPGLVTESPDRDNDGNDLGTTTKSVNYSVLYMKAVKALQEAMNRIETLELTNKNPFNISQTTSLLNNPFITFLNSNGDTAGSIIQNGVNSVTYATSSDYRLKDNVVELTAAIPRLKQLAPKRFNFTAAADVTVDGFLAHEAQAVVPEAVTGSHNQVDGDGNPVMQGIDQSKLVPLLTAALQEAIGRIETLEAKVATLEGS